MHHTEVRWTVDINNWFTFEDLLFWIFLHAENVLNIHFISSIEGAAGCELSC